MTNELFKLLSRNLPLLCYPTAICLSLLPLSTGLRVYTLSSTLVINAPSKASPASATSRRVSPWPFLTGFTRGYSQEWWFLFLRPCPLIYLQRIWFARISSSNGVIFAQVLSSETLSLYPESSLWAQVCIFPARNQFSSGGCLMFDRHNRQSQPTFTLLIYITDFGGVQYFIF